MKKLLLFMFLLTSILILTSSLAIASNYVREGNIKLLAVTEAGTGSTANLNLKITEGTGRVFIDTQPLTKLDTLISTRFANSIACDFLDKDCSDYDFFYTIKAKSAIVGGPSAGSAISVLTIAVLDNKKVPNIAITGTINSGGFIGSVGGIKSKIETAADQGIERVFVPLGDSKFKENNTTTNLIEYGAELGIDVVEVSDLNSAMFEIAGKMYWPENYEIELPEIYILTMKGLANRLCEKSSTLRDELLSQGVTKALADDYIEREIEAFNFTNKAKTAIVEDLYYSAASYCYAANVIYRELLIEFVNDTDKQDIEKIREELAEFESEIDNKPIETITDLQAYMVVKERLSESKYFLNMTNERLNDNDSEYSQDFAVAIERLYSARTWSDFFNKPGKKFVFNRDSLREACDNKISEAEERFQYINTIIPFVHSSVKKELQKAHLDRDTENYVLCLFRAGKAKAETDVFINSLGVDSEDQDLLLDNKLNIAGRNIAKQITDDIFPILGYSYYEYSKDLKESQKYSSLLFSEYALEMSNLDLYFQEVKPVKIEVHLGTNTRLILLFIAGLLVGFAAGVFYLKHIKHKRRLKRRSKK
ncbi:MAG: S16 family serine protease [Nanoarchaeota archaeon]|nr:S16 family serine protease [Nanoarchaeota archaeon]